MKRKHDLLKEKSKTRDAVGQISSWCLLIALHQRFGVGADRMERIAGKAEKLQKEIAAIIDEHGTAAGIAEMQRRLDGICLTEMRVPLNRNTKNRREVELRMAADQTVTAMWCCFALAIHQTLGFGRDRLNRLHKETVENYRQFNEWNGSGSVPGKGPVRCANTIQDWMREAAAKPGDWYFVKMDITKFFFRIPTEVQLRELGRPLDDADMMWFFERAIRCDGRPLGLPLHCTDVTTAERIAGRGMQVGSLVSQMTANVVMTPADHYIKRELCAPYYARYMDDMGAIIEGKAAAWELVEEVDNYLQTNLGLNLNQKTAVIPIGNPVEFVGRKISPVKIELRRQTTLGMKKHLRYVQDAYAAGEIDLDYALSVITSYRGLFKDVTSDAFLEKMLDEFVLSRPALEA